MNLVSVPVALMAAVCLYVGLYYLLFYFRRRNEKENLVFAFTCFSIALYDIFCVGLYNAASHTGGMVWQRLQFAALALFIMAVSWFIYYFTGRRSRKPFMIISAWFSALLAAGLSVRNEWTLSPSNPKPKYIDIGSIIRVTYHEADPGIIYIVQYASMLAVALYILFLVLQYYRDGNRSHARPILFSLCVFFAASVNDALVGMAVYPFIYILEYTYMFIIFSMAYVLQNRFVDLHHEVEELNIRLEEKINERNMELLIRDIGARLFMEIVRDLREGKPEGDPDSLQRLLGSGGAALPTALTRDIGIISNAGMLFSRVIEKAAEISGAKAGRLLLLDDAGMLETAASLGGPATGIVDDVNDGARNAFTSKTRVMWLRGEDRGGEAALVHVLCVPVLSGEIAIGACCIERGVEAGPFSEDDIQLLSAFMRQVAPTIENALVYRKARRARAAGPRPSISPRIEEKLKAAMAYIEENYTADISRENLAASLNMHPDTLSRYFKLYTDRKIAEYANELRVREVARRMKAEPGASIIDIAFAAGFESLATFNRAFVRTMRCTPTEYRERNK